MLRESEINTIFRTTFNGRTNMITPVVLRRAQAGNYLYELSGSDTPLFSMYGVTVLTLEGDRTDRSAAFGSYEEATTFIKSLETAQ